MDIEKSTKNERLKKNDHGTKFKREEYKLHIYILCILNKSVYYIIIQNAPCSDQKNKLPYSHDKPSVQEVVTHFM